MRWLLVMCFVCVVRGQSESPGDNTDVSGLDLLMDLLKDEFSVNASDSNANITAMTTPIPSLNSTVTQPVWTTSSPPSPAPQATTSSTTNSSIPTTSTTITNATTTSTTTARTTTTTTSKPLTPCQKEEFLLKNVCEMTEPWLNLTSSDVDITFSSLRDVIFPPVVLSHVIEQCSPGEWCLKEDDDLVANLGSIMGVCGSEQCLNITEDCQSEERRMTSSTIAMLCQAQANNKTGDCLIAIRKLRLVSEADRIRRETEDGENICYKTEDQETCGGPCQGYAKSIHCACKTCHPGKGLLKHVPEYSWLYEIDSAMMTCHLKGADCSGFASEGYEWQPGYRRVAVESQPMLSSMDVNIVLGITSLCIVAMGIFGVVIFVCGRRFRRKDGYTRDRVGYTEVKDDIHIAEEEIIEDWRD